MRLIDADALVRKWCGMKCGCERDECGREIEPCIVVMAIEDAPTVEVCPHYIRNIHDRGDDSLCGLFHREVKCLAVETRQVGRWIDDNCSVCGQYVHHGDARNYCPNCGARMECDHET